jgi:hypothetical protein
MGRLVPTSLVNRGSLELAPYTITGFTICSSLADTGTVLVRVQGWKSQTIKIHKLAIAYRFSIDF